MPTSSRWAFACGRARRRRAEAVPAHRNHILNRRLAVARAAGAHVWVGADPGLARAVGVPAQHRDLALMDEGGRLIRRTAAVAGTVITWTNIPMPYEGEVILEVAPLSDASGLPEYEIELVQAPRASGTVLDLEVPAFGDLEVVPDNGALIAGTTGGSAWEGLGAGADTCVS